MSDQIESAEAEAPETTEVAPEAEQSKHDKHLQKEIERRKQLKAKLKEYETRLAEYEQRDESLAEQREREAQEFDKLEARYKAKLERETKAREALEAQISEATRLQRQGDLLEEISSRTGVGNKRHLRALLVEAARTDDGLDAAPESLDESTIEMTIKALSGLAPDLFSNQSAVGGAPGSPGVNKTNKRRGEEPADDSRIAAVQAAARYYSGRV